MTFQRNLRPPLLPGSSATKCTQDDRQRRLVGPSLKLATVVLAVLARICSYRNAATTLPASYAMLELFAALSVAQTETATGTTRTPPTSTLASIIRKQSDRAKGRTHLYTLDVMCGTS